MTTIATLAAEYWKLADAGNASDISDDAAEPYLDQAASLAARIAGIEACGASDLAAKVVVWNRDHDEALWRSIIRDADRLAPELAAAL